MGHFMYENIGGGVLGTATAITGIVSLPNTGSSTLLTTLSVVSIVAGALILVTTAMRLVIKKVYKN